MKVTVTLSANAGVAIHVGGYRIWVDALHTQKQRGFSAVDIPLQKRMLQCAAFAEPDLILCTHCHPDHYSDTLTKEAKKLWPDAEVVLPELRFERQIQIKGEEFFHSLGDLSLRFIRLPHDGQQYADCVHYGLLMTIGGKTILLPGDCRTGAVELGKAIGRIRIDLALLNFPWLTLSKGRAFVDTVMKPSQILLYHLPFAEDDCLNYRDAAMKAVQKLDNGNVQLLWEPLQTVELDI